MKSLLLTILLISLASCGPDKSEEADYEKCENTPIVNKDSCKSVSLENKLLQCCYLNFSDSCEIMEEDGILYASSSQFRAEERERGGFECSKYNDCELEEIPSVDIENVEYKCPNRDFIAQWGYDINFSKEELKILADEKHCLKLSEKSQQGKIDAIKKDDCFNAKITDNAKQNSISCGFYNYKLKLFNGSLLSFTTCDLFVPDYLKYSMLPQKDVYERLDDLIDSINFDYLEYDSFDLEVSTSSGTQYRYDSETYNFTKVSVSDSKMIYISKYLYLLLLMSLF